MYKRNWYNNQGYKPQIFYAVFGVNQEDLGISREKYHVDKVPDGILAAVFSRKEEGQKEYMDTFFKQQIGKFLQEKDMYLFEQSQNAEECVIIQGEVKEDESLEYFKNLIGLIQGLCDAGGVSVLDLHTLTWYSPAEWEKTFFEKEFDFIRHLRFMISEKSDGLWIHTRGMVKFGRPDISMLGIPQAGIELAKDLSDQLLYYSTKGVWFDKPIHLNTTAGKFLIKPKYVEDFNDLNFNNAHVEVEFNDIELIEPGMTM